MKTSAPAALMPAMSKEATDYAGDYSKRKQPSSTAQEGVDYQGRTYMHVPQDLDIDLRKEPGSIKNYLPKKLVHTWKSAHQTHHLAPLLPWFGTSAPFFCRGRKSQDLGCVHSRELLRTFSGHSKAISDTDFHPTG